MNITREIVLLEDVSLSIKHSRFLNPEQSSELVDNISYQANRIDYIDLADKILLATGHNSIHDTDLYKVREVERVIREVLREQN